MRIENESTKVPDAEGIELGEYECKKQKIGIRSSLRFSTCVIKNNWILKDDPVGTLIIENV